jgi:hypothetical protein
MIISPHIDDILMGGRCTGTGVSKAKDVSESTSNAPRRDRIIVPIQHQRRGTCGIVSTTSAGVVANVPRRRDGSVVPINKEKCRDLMEYNTVHEQTPTRSEIEHFVHTISAFAVLLGIIIDYAIHSTVANVPEGLVLIDRTFTLKHKRMLATNLDALTPNNLMNGTAYPAPIFRSVLCCPRPPPSLQQ